MKGFCASNQASEIWTGVAFFFSENCLRKSTIGIFAAMFSGEKRGNSDRVSFLGSNFVRASIFAVRYPCPIAPQGTKPIPYAPQIFTTPFYSKSLFIIYYA